MADNPPFDRIGKRYDESFVERDAQVAEGAWLIEQLTGAARVLDLGCGSGLPTAKQLLDAGIEVVGVDESSHDARARRGAGAGRHATCTATCVTSPTSASSTPRSRSSP